MFLIFAFLCFVLPIYNISGKNIVIVCYTTDLQYKLESVPILYLHFLDNYYYNHAE